jgi:N-acyl-phosphatidylethanolamine-hydrolysing phospholipase D
MAMTRQGGMMDVIFKWIGGATWSLKVNSVNIACDPVLCEKDTIQDFGFFKSKRLHAPAYSANDFNEIDLWLLTHGHEDHLDQPGLRAIADTSNIVAHSGLRPVLGQRKATYLKWFENRTIRVGDMEINIQALPAIHATNQLSGMLVGNGNGYLVTFIEGSSEFRVYVTGDSVFKPNHARHFKNISVDLVIANAGGATVGPLGLSRLIGRITNNSDDVGMLTQCLDPKTTIPVHWGTFSHYQDIPDQNSFSDKRIVVPRIGEAITLGV